MEVGIVGWRVRRRDLLLVVASLLLAFVLTSFGHGRVKRHTRVAVTRQVGVGTAEEKLLQRLLALGQGRSDRDSKGRIEFLHVPASFVRSVLIGSLDGVNLGPADKPLWTKVQALDVLTIQDAEITGELDLQHCTIRKEVALEWCQFDDFVKLSNATCLSHFSMEHSYFAKSELNYGDAPLAPIALDYAHFEGCLFFDGAILNGPLSLTRTVVDQNLELKNCHFLWPGIRPGNSLEDQLNTQNACLEAAHLHVGGDLLMWGTECSGPVNLGSTHIGGNFIADGLSPAEAHRHENSGYSVSQWEHSRSSRRSDYSNDPQEQDALICSSTLSLVLDSRSDSDYSVDLSDLVVGGSAHFEETHFRGPVTLKHSQIGHDLALTEADFLGNTSTKGVGTSVDLSRVVVGDRLSLGIHSVANGKPDYSGMSMHAIGPVDDFTTLEGIFLNSVSPFDGMNSLKTFYDGLGESDNSDLAYADGRHLQPRESWLMGEIDNFLYYLCGYGRNPVLAVRWSFVVVLIGSLVFWRSNVEFARSDAPADKQYSSLLYSLGCFIPIVNLGGSGDWRPRDYNELACQNARSRLRCRMVTFYWNLHILSGWILIPIVTATIVAKH
jgi:hypothetical protein